LTSLHAETKEVLTLIRFYISNFISFVVTFFAPEKHFPMKE